MTYILKHLPELEDLKKELETYPNNIKHYLKYGAFNGSSDSMNYLDEKIKSYLKEKEQ